MGEDRRRQREKKKRRQVTGERRKPGEILRKLGRRQLKARRVNEWCEGREKLTGQREEK